MKNSTNGNHAAKIRQLCSLGLNSHLLVPKLIELLHDYVPSQVSSFIWVDNDREFDHVYSEQPKIFELVPTYLAFAELESLGMHDVFAGLPASLNHRSTVNADQLWKVDRETFQQHSFYNEVFRPLDIHTGLFRPIRSNSRVEGALLINRGCKLPQFEEEDFRKMDIVARHIEYSMSVPSEPHARFSNIPSGTEFITTDISGKLLNYSVGAEQLMSMCRQGHNNASGDISPMMRKLAQNLLALSEGKDVCPPTLTFDHKWGRFRITAYFMRPAEVGQSNPLITARIEHFLPSQLLLFEKLQNQKLTFRQTQICLQIGLNRSYDQIANCLGIAKSTVVSHKKEIFDRLNIQSRHQLMDRVLYE